MSKEREFRKKMECTVCKNLNYFTRKNQKTLSKVRLQLSKFCKTCGKHTVHKETK